MRCDAQTLGLVFVAVYQKALKLLYVDALLEQVKQVSARLAPTIFLTASWPCI